jgi:tripartite-type tricarboxylate transporter receptor subunit TctC
MHKLPSGVCRGIAVLFLAASLYPTPASGQTDNDESKWYRDKTINLIVPHGAGGGFDTYARLIAPYFRKHIPGSNVMVQNVTGAGGLRGRNQVYAARPDGLTLGFTTTPGMFFSQWSGLEGVRFDLGKMTWIGRVVAETNVLLVSAKSPFKSFADLKKADRPIRLGFSGIGSDDYYTTAIFARYFGYKIDPITGYAGSREANLGAVKGEIDGVQVQVSSVLQLIKSGDLIPVLSLGMKRDSELPNVPTALEVAEKPEAKEIALVFTNVFQTDRAFFAPPGMPAARVSFLRRAFDRMMQDPELLDASKKSKRPIDALRGEELEKMVADILKVGNQKIQPLVREIAQNAR